MVAFSVESQSVTIVFRFFNCSRFRFSTNALVLLIPSFIDTKSAISSFEVLIANNMVKRLKKNKPMLMKIKFGLIWVSDLYLYMTYMGKKKAERPRNPKNKRIMAPGKWKNLQKSPLM